MAGKETKQVQDFTNFKNYYQHLCNLLGPATNTGATEMTDMGPILKEREKKKVRMWGRRRKKPAFFLGDLESMNVYRVVVRKEACGRGTRNQKKTKKVIFSPFVPYRKDVRYILLFCLSLKLLCPNFFPFTFKFI